MHQRSGPLANVKKNKKKVGDSPAGDSPGHHLAIDASIDYNGEKSDALTLCKSCSTISLILLGCQGGCLVKADALKARQGYALNISQVQRER